MVIPSPLATNWDGQWSIALLRNGRHFFKLIKNIQLLLYKLYKIDIETSPLDIKDDLRR